jgi:adenosylhomocysteinase
MPPEHQVADLSLADEGRQRIEWAANSMPVLRDIREEYLQERPLEGLTVGACLHVTKETANLVRTLQAGGAEVALCGSNPLSTQDDVAAALADEGVHVYAWHGLDDDDYYDCVDWVLDHEVDVTMDDGGDLVSRLHQERRDLLDGVLAGTEETTTGVNRFRAMADDGALEYPIVAVNDAMTKHLFDNRHGTGQSTLDGILRATSILLAGKTFVMGGYGWCGRGIASRADGAGARVIVTEVDPTRALEAAMEGYEVAPMAEAAQEADVVVTSTGNKHVVGEEAIDELADGAILANAGHFDNEIDLPYLESLADEVVEVRPHVEEYRLKDGRTVHVVGEGRLVNLAAAEGHPPEVMDMSFANQARTVAWLREQADELSSEVLDVPEAIDEDIAARKLEAMGMGVDTLTDEQREYMGSWTEGT